MGGDEEGDGDAGEDEHVETEVDGAERVNL